MTSTTTLLLSQSVLGLIMAAGIAVSFLLLRQLRALHRRIAPLGALSPVAAQTGPIATRHLQTLAGTPLTLPSPAEPGAPRLLLFVDGTCPVSRKMVPILRDFCRTERLMPLFCGDDETPTQLRAAERLGIAPTEFVNDATIGRELGVDRLPFAVLLDAQGAVIARGLVNSREHLESLVSVRETGHDSVQSYVAAHPEALPH